MAVTNCFVRGLLYRAIKLLAAAICDYLVEINSSNFKVVLGIRVVIHVQGINALKKNWNKRGSVV